MESTIAMIPDVSERQQFMELALAEASKCTPTAEAFCVGAVIVRSSQAISTGFSRELPDNTHAEQCAIEKLIDSKGKETAFQLLRGADIYTTMEPCSVRLSGNRPCTDRLLDVGIGRVFLGTMEPDEFVKCEGTRKLQEKGVEIFVVEGAAEKCLEVARRGH